jgi:hypothetical protein
MARSPSVDSMHRPSSRTNVIQAISVDKFSPETDSWRSCRPRGGFRRLVIRAGGGCADARMARSCGSSSPIWRCARTSAASAPFARASHRRNDGHSKMNGETDPRGVAGLRRAQGQWRRILSLASRADVRLQNGDAPLAINFELSQRHRSRTPKRNYSDFKGNSRLAMN